MQRRTLRQFLKGREEEKKSDKTEMWLAVFHNRLLDKTYLNPGSRDSVQREKWGLPEHATLPRIEAWSRGRK